MPRVYSYAAYTDASCRDIIHAELDGATEYRRALVNIELVRRVATEAAEARHSPKLGTARAELAALEEFLVRDDHTDDDRATLKLARESARALRAFIKQELADIAAITKPAQDLWDEALLQRAQELSPGAGPRTRETAAAGLEAGFVVSPTLPRVWVECFIANRNAARATKDARAAKACSSGTSLLVEQDVHGAKRTPVGFGKHKRVGRLSVKLAPPVPLDKLSRVCSITRHPGWADTRAKRKLRRFSLKLNGAGLTVRGDMRMHRPLPDDAHVTLIQLVPNGRHWFLQFTCETERELRARGTGAPVAVAICWEQDGDDIIAGVTSTGEQLRFPDAARREAYASSLMRLTDTLLDEGLPTIASLAEQSDASITRWVDAVRTVVPVRDCVETMGRRGARLVPLAVARALTDGVQFDWWQRWRRERKAAGLDLYATRHELAVWLGRAIDETSLDWVFLWLRKTQHIWDMYCGVRRNTATRRKKDSELHAARVYSEHSAVVVDGRDLSIRAMKAKGTADNSRRQKAAPSNLREKLKLAYGEHAFESESIDAPSPTVQAQELITRYNAGALATKKRSKIRHLRQRKQVRSVADKIAKAAARKPPGKAAE